MNRGVIDFAHAVVFASNATGCRRLVLVALALHAYERGHARLPVTTLAKWAGTDRRDVQRALVDLTRSGEIAVVDRSAGLWLVKEAP